MVGNYTGEERRMQESMAAFAEAEARKSQTERNIYNRGWNDALERAAARLESANDETSIQCLIAAIRAMAHHVDG